MTPWAVWAGLEMTQIPFTSVIWLWFQRIVHATLMELFCDTFFASTRCFVCSGPSGCASSLSSFCPSPSEPAA
eukprot:6458578-Amphidinium_carterae.1